jgi:hypothetical protein
LRRQIGRLFDVLKAALGILLVGRILFGTLWSRLGWRVAVVFCFREKEDQEYKVECRQAQGEPEEASPTMSKRSPRLVRTITIDICSENAFAYLSAMFPEITGPIKRPRKYDVLQ